jgi:hypothetical protein
MFTVDGYRYGGKDFDRLGVVAEVASQIPSLERLVVVPYLSASPELSALEEHEGVAPPMTWGQLLDLGSGAELAFERVPFDHPLWVLYSSGTTGLPKAIVQGHGGILLEQLKKGYPPLLVHDHRLDDVELPDRRAAHPGLDRPLRRQPRDPRHGRALGPGGAHRDDHLRDQRGVHRRLHEGRRGTGQGP